MEGKNYFLALTYASYIPLYLALFGTRYLAYIGRVLQSAPY